MHLQGPPFNEYKVVFCVEGSILDLLFDCRPQSDTFLNIQTVELKDTSSKLILIPPGVAHGFQTLKDNTTLLYLHTEAYLHEKQIGFSPLDPAVKSQWPLQVREVSDRDRAAPSVKDFTGELQELQKQ